jgi:monoterpene epsilon-lactone hydrolase
MAIDETEVDPTTPPVTRVIPVPRSVSPEAQRALTTSAYTGSGSERPPLDDVAGWKALIREMDASVMAALAPAAQIPADVHETSVDGIPVFVITPEGVSDGSDQPIALDIHGGALVMGGGACCRLMGIASATQVGLRSWAVDYRMPPDHPYPAALDDCITVYRALLEQQPATRIVVRGASAGGNLAAALVLRARDEGLPLPGALVLMTPEVDLTESGDSFQTNLGIVNVLTSSLAAENALYANGHDLADPYLSPLFGDLTSPFPPTFLQAGTRDLFLSNAVRMHRKLRAGGVDAELHIFEAMPHGGFRGAPEDFELTAELRRFIASHLFPGA